MKNPLTPTGIEPATFRFVAQHLNHCATAVPASTLCCRIILVQLTFGGTWWRSWLRHRATRRKTAGFIPSGVAGIFHWHNPYGRTMALGSTEPLTEMSTWNISWRWGGGGKGGGGVGLTTPSMCRLFWNLRASNSWNPQGLSRPVMRLLYFYSLLFKIIKC